MLLACQNYDDILGAFVPRSIFDVQRLLSLEEEFTFYTSPSWVIHEAFPARAQLYAAQELLT